MLPTPAYVEWDMWGSGWWVVFENTQAIDEPYAFESYDAHFVTP